MSEHFHHVHLFAKDIDSTLSWWKEMLSAEILFDGILAGARNVFLKVGSGRIHFYDQAPRADLPQGAVHHLGIRTTNLKKLVERLHSKGVSLRSEIRDFGSWKYIMCLAPDQVLLEIFEVDADQQSKELAHYFGDETSV